MKIRKKMWLRLSLKKKLTAMFAAVIAMISVSEGAMIGVMYFSLKKFEGIMANNAIYHELQEALKEEQQTFITYIRNRTDENRIAFEAACAQSGQCIGALPFTYDGLGEERYARTWNLFNGYEGYESYRDAVVKKAESDPDYIADLYETLGMQENLSAYADRLVQVTLDQWNTAYRENMGTVRRIPYLAVGAACTLLFLAYRTWKFLAAAVAEPVILLSEDAGRIEQNDFSAPDLQVENEDEIGGLVSAFNRMKRAMQSYIATLEEKNRIAELLHRKELEKSEAENALERARLDILKHQVNPHFLFNTLNMVSGMAKLEEAQTTDQMIVSLGNLFRYNLRTREQEVYLEEELRVLEDYIYIQKMRFGSRIEYRSIVLADEGRVRLPAFTLQPVVENVFVHGLSGRESGGRILLKIRQRDNMLVILVADNGCGMDPETLKRLNQKIHEGDTSKTGIGLSNICRRVEMLYQTGKVWVYSKEGKGTVVKLLIPQEE